MDRLKKSKFGGVVDVEAKVFSYRQAAAVFQLNNQHEILEQLLPTEVVMQQTQQQILQFFDEHSGKLG